ncbi:MAG: NAD(+)/NADH kinase [Armatimonadetes bacterium]|nr:NAD(+)/NADH kinase [Armatimonadota bacterium]
MRIHLLLNKHRRDAVDAARSTIEMLMARGVEVSVECDAKSLFGTSSFEPEDTGLADIVICFGGDGTVMRAAHLCSETRTPILGVYFGRFGFVTQCKGEELGACLSQILDGNLRTEERMMLRASLVREGVTMAEIHALNDVVLQRAAPARMMTFRVTIDGERVTSYPADGVLVATATGSTAYNLSAGGPIMDPKVRAMILTAISPHTLSARPLVLKYDSVIRLELQTEGDAVLNVDGQTRLHLLSDDVVTVQMSERVTQLVTVDPADFLAKLRERLLWARVAERGLE